MDIDSIYRLYFRDVFLFLQGLTHNEALAEELTQETFFKALDGLKDYDDRQDVRAWLFTVARNAYYSHCRRTKHTAPLEDAETAPADTPDIAQLLVDQDAAFTVHQCLHILDEPYKEVFSLRVFGELPFERIGLIFGHNAAWARVTYYRAKTQLVHDEPGHVCAHHDDIAVGKVQQQDNAVHHAVAQCDQCIDAAKGQAVDQLAKEHCHGWILPFFAAFTLFDIKNGERLTRKKLFRRSPKKSWGLLCAGGSITGGWNSADQNISFSSGLPST